MISTMTSLKNAGILESSHAEKQTVMIEKYNDNLISILNVFRIDF
jgi:hypothetical protein